jgi:hypothetical protein
MDDYTPRVIVKFRDTSGISQLPYADDIGDQIDAASIAPWRMLEQANEGIRLLRLYTTLAVEEIQQLMQAAKGDPEYEPVNLLTYFAILCPPPVNPDAVVSAVQQTFPAVELVYVESGPAEPPQACADLAAAGLSPRSAAPTGVNADAAGATNVRGTGMICFVIEQGWVFNHDDLLDNAGDPKVQLISGVNKKYRGHGTSVLSVLQGRANGLGATGLVNGAVCRTVSEWRSSTNWNLPDAITEATKYLPKGNVLLIEAETTRGLPVLVEKAVFHAISVATASGVNGKPGIVVVIAAGNAGRDIGPLLPNGDAGAIIVGAGSPVLNGPYGRIPLSNFGVNVHCHAWGDCVQTAGEHNDSTATNLYRPNFGGTSAAAAIVAGVAVAVQGVRNAKHKPLLKPKDVRTKLMQNGTRANSPNEPIGIMPNLANIVPTL